MNDSKKHDTATEWRLVPMVNLVSLVVPTLLMASWVLTGGWQSLSPSNTLPPDVQPTPWSSPLDLAVHVTQSGFEITGDEGLLSSEGHSLTVSCSTAPCASTSDYDVDALQERLLVIKAAHPDQIDITLVAHPDIPFGQVMDLRQALSQTTSELGPSELFPWVVVSESR